MNEPKEFSELEKAIQAFQNLAEKDPFAIHGLEDRLKQLAKDIADLVK